jgi:RNA polymerase sigma-70 factor (ECF subfamily)
MIGDSGDGVIVRRVLGGDADAFGALLARYRDAHTRFAVRMLGSHADADDALQSAFVRAYRNLASCREPERFGAWLYQIVVNECRTFATRRDQRARRYAQDEESLASHPATDESDAATLEEIQRALDRLPADQREAFVLKHVEELSYEEMAEITGAGVSALKMRVKRACAHLRELLAEVQHD